MSVLDCSAVFSIVKRSQLVLEYRLNLVLNVFLSPVGAEDDLLGASAVL